VTAAYPAQPGFAGGLHGGLHQPDHRVARQALLGGEQMIPVQCGGGQYAVAVYRGLLQQHAQQARVNRVHQCFGTGRGAGLRGWVFTLGGRRKRHVWQFKTIFWRRYRW